MFKRSRIMAALVMGGAILAGTGAQAHPGGGNGGGRWGGFGGGYSRGWRGSGWYRPSYYNSYYYQPAPVLSAPAVRYLVPAEYSGTPGGYLINYGGANYITNGDGTMSPY